MAGLGGRESPFVRSIKWYPRSVGNVAEVGDDGRVQWHARHPALGLGLPLRIAGDDDAGSAGERLGGTEHAHPIVDLPFELVGVNEAIDPQRSEEMTDTLADAAGR